MIVQLEDGLELNLLVPEESSIETTRVFQTLSEINDWTVINWVRGDVTTCLFKVAHGPARMWINFDDRDATVGIFLGEIPFVPLKDYWYCIPIGSPLSLTTDGSNVLVHIR